MIRAAFVEAILSGGLLIGFGWAALHLVTWGIP